MKSLNINIFFFSVLFSFASCTPNWEDAKETTPKKLSAFLHEPVANHILYHGSDEQYHYFSYTVLMKKEKYYKVSKTDLHSTEEFSLKDKKSVRFVIYIETIDAETQWFLKYQ